MYMYVNGPNSKPITHVGSETSGSSSPMNRSCNNSEVSHLIQYSSLPHFHTTDIKVLSTDTLQPFVQHSLRKYCLL